MNQIENVYDKFEYYQKAYNDYLTHKYLDGIRIVGFTHGHSLTDIQYELIMNGYEHIEHEEGFIGE